MPPMIAIALLVIKKTCWGVVGFEKAVRKKTLVTVAMAVTPVVSIKRVFFMVLWLVGLDPSFCQECNLRRESCLELGARSQELEGRITSA